MAHQRRQEAGERVAAVSVLQHSGGRLNSDSEAYLLSCVVCSSRSFETLRFGPCGLCRFQQQHYMLQNFFHVVVFFFFSKRHAAAEKCDSAARLSRLGFLFLFLFKDNLIT